MEGRETSGGVGALGEVLAPREARRRAPGKKELVLARREGGEQRIHSKAQARLRVPWGGSPRSSSEGAREVRRVDSLEKTLTLGVQGPSMTFSKDFSANHLGK